MGIGDYWCRRRQKTEVLICFCDLFGFKLVTPKSLMTLGTIRTSHRRQTTNGSKDDPRRARKTKTERSLRTLRQHEPAFLTQPTLETLSGIQIEIKCQIKIHRMPLLALALLLPLEI
jgi:hypothetical protein